MKLKLPRGAIVRAVIAIAAPVLADKAGKIILKQADKLTQKKDR